MMSLPPRPLSVSSPPRPLMLSAPGVPLIVSGSRRAGEVRGDGDRRCEQHDHRRDAFRAEPSYAASCVPSEVLKLAVVCGLPAATVFLWIPVGVRNSQGNPQSRAQRRNRLTVRIPCRSGVLYWDVTRDRSLDPRTPASVSRPQRAVHRRRGDRGAARRDPQRLADHRPEGRRVPGARSRRISHAPHVRCLSSCTAGLTIALRAVGNRTGRRGLVPSMTFVSCANVVEHAGAGRCSSTPIPRPA